MDEILTVREVAEYLKLSRTTIWRWCHVGKLRAFKVGRGWRIHRSEMERIVGQNPGPMKETEDRKHGTSQHVAEHPD